MKSFAFPTDTNYAARGLAFGMRVAASDPWVGYRAMGPKRVAPLGVAE